jgi:hypothetical protein
LSFRALYWSELTISVWVSVKVSSLPDSEINNSTAIQGKVSSSCNFVLGFAVV